MHIPPDMPKTGPLLLYCFPWAVVLPQVLAEFPMELVSALVAGRWAAAGRPFQPWLAGYRARLVLAAARYDGLGCWQSHAVAMAAAACAAWAACTCMPGTRLPLELPAAGPVRGATSCTCWPGRN